MDRSAPIEELRNLGPKSSAWLRSVDVRTIGDLERLGPAGAFQLVRAHHPRVSRNLLWAMAAGLQGLDWRELDEKTKLRLLKDVESE